MNIVEVILDSQSTANQMPLLRYLFLTDEGHSLVGLTDLTPHSSHRLQRLRHTLQEKWP